MVIKVLYQAPMENENYFEDKWIAYFENTELDGMCESGHSKQEAYDSLMHTLLVKIQHDCNVDNTDVRTLPAFLSQAEKWQALEKATEKVFIGEDGEVRADDDETGGDLLTVGEIAAQHLGWLS